MDSLRFFQYFTSVLPVFTRFSLVFHKCYKNVSKVLQSCLFALKSLQQIIHQMDEKFVSSIGVQKLSSRTFTDYNYLWVICKIFYEATIVCKDCWYCWKKNWSLRLFFGVRILLEVARNFIIENGMVPFTPIGMEWSHSIPIGMEWSFHSYRNEELIPFL